MTTTLTPPPKADPEVCRFLDAMIREFETHDLCKGANARDANGKHVAECSGDVAALCIAGCRWRVAMQLGLTDGAVRNKARILMEQTYPSGLDAPGFNDLPSTTKADVIAKIKEAKALAGCTQD